MAVMLKWYSFQFLFLIRIGFHSVYKNVLKKTKNLKKEKYYYQIISLGFKYFPEFWMKGFFLFKGYFPIQNFEKIAPKISSLETPPVISPSASKARRISRANNSPEIRF